MQLSFLIGSGFSVIDNYPSRSDINLRLRRIDQSEISINPDGTSFFLNGRSDPNNDLLLEEKYFVQRLIDYYTLNIIPNIEGFDYEYFFDFYQGFINGKYSCFRFEEFMDNFRSEFNLTTDNLNLLDQFNRTFNQLISDLLYKNPGKVHLTKPYSKYSSFLTFIDEVKGSYDKINIHTLNHDLLLEELSNSDAFEQELCDGFEEYGSPFYSKNGEGKDVRLKRFTNSFHGKFSLLKLHGSLDNYIFSYYDTIKEEVKIPSNVTIDALFKEVEDKEGMVRREKCFWNYYPDFLSGTTNKTSYYSESCYYKPLFDRFISNLKESCALISIGYGFKDYRINELIKENFLNYNSKKMIIIGPSEPQCEFMKSDNVRYYGNNLGVQDISKHRIDELIRD
jgi:SIR2-like domain